MLEWCNPHTEVKMAIFLRGNIWWMEYRTRSERVVKSTGFPKEQKKDAQVYISQLRTKIDILTAMVYNDNRFNEIEDIYDQITKVAFEQKVEIDVIHDFASFLYDQNKLEKAYTIAKRLENLIADDDNEQETARLYHLLAYISDEFSSKKDEASKKTKSDCSFIEILISF
jgi:hypothetical protein